MIVSKNGVWPDLKHPVHEGGCERACPVSQELRLAQHPVVVLVKVQVLTVHAEGRRGRKPVGFLQVLGQVLSTQL